MTEEKTGPFGWSPAARGLSAFALFTAAFAVLAAWVFDGTWALDMAPVMPDCPVSFSAEPVREWVNGWMESGKFVPGDIAVFLGEPYFWIELKYALAVYCAALGMAFFLRGRGAGLPASYGASLLLAFSGYWFSLFSAGHLGWFQWMTYGVFAFGLADRAVERGGIMYWILLGAVLAWGSFYQPDMWLLFTVFTAAYFIFRAVSFFRAERDRECAKGCFRRFLCGGIAALAVFAAVGTPSFRSAIVNDIAGRDRQIDEGQTVEGAPADDGEKRWIFVTNWSMPPEDTLEFFIPRINGDTSCPITLAVGNMRKTGVEPYTGRLGRPKDAPSGNYRQHSLYVGWVTCLLAVFGVASVFRRRKNRDADRPAMSRGTAMFFLSAGIVFWLFSMGRYCEPVYRCVFALPMGDYLRAPVKWHHLTEFCIAVLAGYGLEAAGRMLSRRRFLAAAVPCAIAFAGACDLARVDKLFCAPRHVDTEIGPLPQPVPENPADAARFAAAVRSHGLNPAGKSKMPFKMGNGEIREFDVLWVERRITRPPARKEAELDPQTGFARTCAVVSALSTIAVLVAAFAAGLIFLLRYFKKTG